MKRKDNIFLDAMFKRPQTNRFDLSHEVKFSTKLGSLTPTCILECLPGDSFSFGSTDFMRFFPLKSPVMHRFRLAKNWFFIPNRILWTAFPDWIFDADSADENPYVIIDDVVEVGSLADYMGIPPGDYSNNDVPYKVNLLPFAAYVLVHDEFYKQQFIETPQFVDIVPGDNSTAWQAIVLGPLLRAAWEKDYFTTALPFPQDSATGVQIPLTFQDDIPVTVINDNIAVLMEDVGTGVPAGNGNLSVVGGVLNATTTGPAYLNPNGSLGVDVQSDAALITDLRRAFRLQEFLEKIITGGKRYIETLMTIFGVRSSDARLQRPEYIVGKTSKVVVSEVLANTDAGADQPLGAMAGHGILVSGSDESHYACEEHGWLLCLGVCRPDTAYQDGIHRMFTRTNPLDYAIPDFALIGEQAILVGELQSIAFGVGADPLATFGYQKRFAEYMFMNSRVASQMRTTLAFWHDGRIFDTPGVPPQLSEEFIACAPRLDIFALTDPDDDHLIMQVLNHVSVSRKLPRHSIPTI